jgi:predicted PhzF superfamily epimerase YddE/YHI9
VDTLVTKAGPIAIHVDSPGHVGVKIPHNTHLHQKTTSFMPPDIQKLQLHPNLAVRRAELIAPIFSIVDGMNFGLIQLKNLEELSLVFPGASGFSTANNLLDAGWKNTYMARYYYVVLSSSSASSQTSYVALRTRMMEKNFEDPATGAAAAALSAYYALYKCDKTELQVSITQGVEFGRQSDISVYVAVGVGEDGKRMIKEVRLGGTATQTLKGSIMVPPV